MPSRAALALPPTTPEPLCQASLVVEELPGGEVSAYFCDLDPDHVKLGTPHRDRWLDYTWASS